MYENVRVSQLRWSQRTWMSLELLNGSAALNVNVGSMAYGRLHALLGENPIAPLVKVKKMWPCMWRRRLMTTWLNLLLPWMLPAPEPEEVSEHDESSISNTANEPSGLLAISIIKSRGMEMVSCWTSYRTLWFYLLHSWPGSKHSVI